MRDTSIDAFHEMEEVLSLMRLEAYNMLHDHGPLTGREMNARADNPSFHKRLSELEDMGVIYTPGKRVCTVTGLLVHEWLVTSGSPKKLIKQAPPRPKAEQILVAVNFMRWLYVLASYRKKAVPDEFVVVVRWLRWLSRKAKKGHIRTVPVGPWLMDGHCAMRCLYGTDASRVENRVAFIEKTPRVRVALGEEQGSWEQGPKGSAPECGRHQPSREWCDLRLVELGYVW